MRALKNKPFGMGYNEQGQLGDGTLINKNIPTEILESNLRVFLEDFITVHLLKKWKSMVTGWFEDLNVSAQFLTS